MIYVGLGSNKPGKAGEPAEMMVQAIRLMDERGLGVRRWSSFYRTDAVPNAADPKFLNMVIESGPGTGPEALLIELHCRERQLGRRRNVPNEPRSIDLDLIDFMGVLRNGKRGPVLPHPRLHLRAFVLKPLLEIAPAWRHPVSKKSGFSLLKALDPQNRAQRLG